MVIHSFINTTLRGAFKVVDHIKKKRNFDDSLQGSSNVTQGPRNQIHFEIKSTTLREIKLNTEESKSNLKTLEIKSTILGEIKSFDKLR